MININNTHAFQAVKSENISRLQELDEIKQIHKDSNDKQLSQIMTQVQSFLEIKSIDNELKIEEVQDFKSFLQEIGYEGDPIGSLSQEEAGELVSEEGFFGIAKTSERIADFVLLGAKGNEETLREGRKGILQGFDEAEKLWGSKLPEIAYETINKAVEMIDKALLEGGFSILDVKS